MGDGKPDCVRKWLLLIFCPPAACLLVAVLYRYFNEHVLVKLLVHCKGCVLGSDVWLDANDFTVLFFIALCVGGAAPVLLLRSKLKYPLALLLCRLNFYLCWDYVEMNQWA